MVVVTGHDGNAGVVVHCTAVAAAVADTAALLLAVTQFGPIIIGQAGAVPAAPRIHGSGATRSLGAARAHSLPPPLPLLLQLSALVYRCIHCRCWLPLRRLAGSTGLATGAAVISPPLLLLQSR